MKKTVLCMFALILTITWAVPASADELSDAKSKKEQIQNSISSIDQKKAAQQSALKQALNQKENILDDKKKKDQEYKQLQSVIQNLNAEIVNIEQDLTESQKNYDDQVKLFKTRLVAMYEYSDMSSLEILMESKSISDFLDRLELMSFIAQKDKQSVKDLLLAKQSVEYYKKQKMSSLEQKRKLAEDKKQSISQLNASRASLDVQINTISIKLDQLERQEDEMLQQSKALDDKIKKLMKRGGSFSGSMAWPVPASYQISSYYGTRMHPILHKLRFHSGIDIPASKGSSVLSAASGTVIMAGWYGDYGNCIIIDHGGKVATLYGHLSRILISEGDQVKKGEVIGRVGSTGLSTGPHLHFEVRVNGGTVNPMNYYKKTY